MRQVDPARRRRRGYGAQQRVDIDRAAGGFLPFRAGAVDRIAAAAAELGAHPAGEQAEARAGVVLEAAPLDRIDGERERRRRFAQQRRNLQQLGKRRRCRTRQGEAGQGVEHRLGNARGPQQAHQQVRHLAAGPLDRRRILAVERVAERAGAFGVEARLGNERGDQGGRVEIDRKAPLDPERAERIGRQQDDLGIAGGAGADADELEAHLAELALGPELAAPHPQDFAGIAEAERPRAPRKPRGRDARDLRREVAAHGHHAVRRRVHQAERLIGEPGACAAQHAVLELHERRLDPLVAVRPEARQQGFGERGLGARLGRQQVAQTGGQQGRCLGFRHGGDTLQPPRGRRNGRAGTGSLAARTTA